MIYRAKMVYQWKESVKNETFINIIRAPENYNKGGN